MKLTKIFIFILIALLLLPAIISCGDNSTADETQDNSTNGEDIQESTEDNQNGNTTGENNENYNIEKGEDSINASIEQLPQLATLGNMVVLAEDNTKKVWLTGLNLGGSNWIRSLDGENIPLQIDEIIANWNVNVIRLPVSLAGWHGAIRWWPDDPGSSDGYQWDVKNIVKKFNDAGIYVILDLHEFNYPANEYSYFDSGHDYTDGVPHVYPGVIDFWSQIAQDKFYANNPGVLFGIFNEHTYETSDKPESWDIWRNGGIHQNGDVIVGHQQIVEAIRSLGAKNIIIAGGLDWAYDLSGVAGTAKGAEGISFALEDKSSEGNPDKTGYGIIYDAHIYPWKDSAGWDYHVGEARKLYPVIIGENGYDPNDGTQKQHAPQWNENRHGEWVSMFFDWVNDVDGTYGGIPAHWTGWCFHTGASPRILADWDFNPTEYWGVYVKEQLLARKYS